MKNAIIELTEISKGITREGDAAQEVFDLGRANFYVDHYIALQDLLYPDDSPHQDLVASPTRGAYARAFFETFDEDTYPNLAGYVEKKSELSARSTGEFLDDAELYYYCPYCGDYAEDAEFSATLVPALSDDEDSQSGPGYEPQADGTYKTVTTNDAYALDQSTLLVAADVPGNGGTAAPIGGPSGPTRVECDLNGYCCEYNDQDVALTCWCQDGGFDCYDNPGGPPVTGRMWENCDLTTSLHYGWLRSTRTLDGWNIFVGNRDGNELVLLYFAADDANFGGLDDDNQVAMTGTSAIQNIYVSRSDVTADRRNWIGAILDGRWQCTDIEHGFVMYEDDQEGETSISVPIQLQLTGTVTAGVDLEIAEIERAIGREITIGVTLENTVTSDDDVAWQIEMARGEFMPRNRRDIGSGTQAPHDILAIEEMEREEMPYYGGGLEVWITLPEVTWQN